jgi:adenylate cyclase class IV
MIEIEKKFLLTEAEQQALLQHAQELGQKVVKDSYFQNDDFCLTTNNFWLWERDGAYELNAPLKSNNGSPSLVNRYHEITDVEGIKQELGLNDDNDFESTLSAAGIAPFMTCYTERRSYEKQGFHIDVDIVTYADSTFKYAIAEIELLIDDESQADEAEERIIKFAKSFNLTTDKIILGKVGAYIEAVRPDHYKLLVDAGVLK